VTLVAASATDWITAISTAALGVLGFGFTIWQWRASGFRPQLSAVIDGRRQAIAVSLVNRGRAPGLIRDVAVVQLRADGGSDVHRYPVEKFPDGFAPTSLPGLAAMRLIVMVAAELPDEPVARATHRFPDDIEVLVRWGAGKETYLDPEPTAPGIGLYGLPSQLPPAS
jgi:hypothetical protein